jgi:PAS domain S-box-containing protein
MAASAPPQVPVADPVRAAYEVETQSRCRRGASTYCLLAALIVLVSAPLDRVRFPAVAFTLLPIRLAGVAAFVTIFGLLQSRWGRRHPRRFALLAPAAVATLLLGLGFVTGKAASPVNVSFNFLILGTALLIPWPARWTALACVVVLAEYVSGALVEGTKATGLVDNLVVFTVNSALAVGMTLGLERRRVREFTNQWALAAAHQALRESDSRLRAVVANLPVVLFTVDTAGILTLSEGKGLARLGLSPGAAVGRHISEVLTELGTDWTSYAAYFAQAFAGNETSWVGTTGGGIFESRLTPIRDAGGRITGLIGIAIDVTERTQAEEARLALERNLLEAQKLESLGVLAGGVAHDFNNLLVSVLGNVSLALEDLPADAPARAKLRRIETAARRGSDLTRQMLAYTGKGTVMVERVDVNAVVEEMKDLLQVSMGRRMHVDYELAEALPTIEADPTQIRQVVMNLVINASDSIGERDGVIRVRTGVTNLGEQELQATQHAPNAEPGPHVCLEVRDTGCGMDAATIARIFDPFFSTKTAGRGLGLATVLGVVRGHRGALRVSSEPGRGTTFRIFLPCPDGAAAAAEATRDAVSSPATEEPEGRTVLLVDDEDDVRTVTAHMLERLGCSVLVAGDGREGVEVFRAHARTIDAVILDLTLPRLSGERAFREIRDIRPDARVILMSGYSEEMVARRLNDIGVAGFLRKPFSVTDLRSTMGRALT